MKLDDVSVNECQDVLKVALRKRYAVAVETRERIGNLDVGCH